MLTLMLDNNIVIDHLLQREPFYKLSRLTCLLGLTGQAQTCISINMLSDIFYILHKRLGSQSAQRVIEQDLDFLQVIGLSPEDGARALSLRWPDFEDALVAQAARKANADYIITRNEQDFALSPIPALSPEGLFALYESQGVFYEECWWNNPLADA